jgi:glyoxylase-like metal-dependent hydrolase (beta-lactamase superfamily II)
MIISLGNQFSMGSFQALSADYLIDKDFSLREFGLDGYVTPTPGHTTGSISIILNNQKALVGDTLFHLFPNSIIPPFMDEPKNLLATWNQLAEKNIQTFYPGHGSPVSRDMLLNQIPRLEKKTE